MSITIDYTTRCDGCNIAVQHHIAWTVEAWANAQAYADIWGPGWPESWIQENAQGDSLPMFFHNRACYLAWLRGHGREQEAQEAENAVWVA